ncbi:Uncharacterized protein SCF082_LOCUS47961 [Durusdinium trenchii]|uniref:ParB/Sulfiredoxin domain-containing protein n=1 Tax=Durusdinium trenchii TaxID=1381693 RepID=A0ABP0RTR7_9DINO
MDGNGSARNDVPAFVRDHIVHRQHGERDAAHGIEGMPPNFGRPIVRHIESFQSFVTSASHVYRDYDEATKDSLDNARFMRNDCGLMECIESRQRAVALLNWHIEPEDEHSQEQKDLAARMTNILERIPRFTEYRYNLLHAVWYGKYGIQHRYRWQTIKGIRSIVPTSRGDERGWQPVNGDKLVFRVDDPTRLREGQYPNQMGIRVGARYAAGDYIHDRWKVEPTDRGMAYFLSPAERKLVTVHRHLIEDGAYEDALSAGSINGVGIRSRIYWDWVQKQESLGFLMEYLERSAGGIELWKYPAGNPQAKDEVEQAAKERSAGRNQLLVPIPAGDEGLQYGIEVIEPGMAGIEVLQSLLNDYFGHRIKRYILGQTLSSEAAATGLGSGVAELHLDTFLQIIHYDARNLEETITEDLLRPLQKWNEPNHAHVNLRFVIDTEEQQAKEKLEAFHSAWEMGARIKESDVLDTIGASVPAEDEKTLTNPAIQQAEMMAQMQQGGQNPMQMGMPGMATGAQAQVPADISPEAMGEQLMQSLNSIESMDDGRNETYVKEGEEWVERELPDHDTGDRHRYRRFHPKQKKLEQWITIGGEAKDGKNHAGGTPVKVDGSGNIVAGPKGLKGRSMDSVDQDKEQPAPSRKGGRVQIVPKKMGDRWYAMADLPDGRQITRSDESQAKAVELATEEAKSYGFRPWSLQRPKRQKWLHNPMDSFTSAPEPPISQMPGAEKPLERLRQGEHADKVGSTAMHVDDLSVDPSRFQYKVSGIGADGVTGELKSVDSWNPVLAGVVTVWHDPNDGKTYVVNGHHRAELARRAIGKPLAKLPSGMAHDSAFDNGDGTYNGALQVQYIDAASPQEARAMGALANIAEGRGSATDAAKFMRDTGIKPDELGEYGVSLKGSTAANGAILSKLSDGLFRRLVDGVISENRALAIARNLPDQEKQNQLYGMIQRAEEARDLTDGAIAEMAREMAVAPSVKGGGGPSLFGDTPERSLIAERGTLKAHLRRELTSVRNAFKTASSTRRQSVLEQTGENKIDVEGNRQQAQQADQLLWDFDKRVNAKGDPIAQAVSDAAIEMDKDPRGQKRIQAALLERARGVLSAPVGSVAPRQRSIRSDSVDAHSTDDGEADQYAKQGTLWREEDHPRDDDGRFTDGDGNRQVTLPERAKAFKVPRGAKLAQPFPQEGFTPEQARAMTGREAAQVEKMVSKLQDARLAYFERISDAEFERVTDNGYLIDSNGERKDVEDWSLDQSTLDIWGSWEAADAAPQVDYGIDDEDDTMPYGRLRQALKRALYAKFDESQHPRDEMGRFVKAYRIHDGEFTEKDLHDNHMSRLWQDTGDPEQDRPRRGLSATATYDALLAYFTGSTGMSIGRSANFDNAHFVEFEGDPSDDDAWEESEGEILVHPKRIVSSVPVRDSQFMADLTDAINERWESYKDSPDNRFEYDFDYSEWKEIQRPRIEPDDYEEDDISYEELVEHYADRLAAGKETEDSIRELTYDRFVEHVKQDLQTRIR